jgi:hypothetical protein
MGRLSASTFGATNGTELRWTSSETRNDRRKAAKGVQLLKRYRRCRHIQTPSADYFWNFGGVRNPEAV